MRVRLGDENREAARLLPPTRPDGSGIGVNWIEEYVRPFNGELPDGRAVRLRRHGLKLVLSVGVVTGEGLLRRLDFGPDPRAVFSHALQAAADGVGVRISIEEGGVYLETA